MPVANDTRSGDKDYVPLTWNAASEAHENEMSETFVKDGMLGDHR